MLLRPGAGPQNGESKLGAGGNHSTGSGLVTAEKNVWRVFGECGEPLVNALAELGAFGVAFISLRDNLDLSTPSGRLMFQIIGAMAEFERALIQERVKAGLRNARNKGKRLGRPRTIVDASRIAALRASGASWRAISRELGVGIATLYRHEGA